MSNDNKTKPTQAAVDELLGSLDAKKRGESHVLIDLMHEVSGEEPVMWGSSIIGFGAYHYKYASGREGDWMKIGFSPRKSAFSLYLSCELSELADELAELGTYTHGKGCIYIKKLDDINLNVLKHMADKAYHLTSNYESKP